MREWEYRIVDSRDTPKGGAFKDRERETVENCLNELGEQGWEIINLDFQGVLAGSFEFSGVAKREAGV